MLALDLYEEGLCRHCGGQLDETTDPENEDRYVVLPPILCHRCEGFARADDRYRDHPHPHVLMHRVELRR